jgi:hypothetical protein
VSAFNDHVLGGVRAQPNSFHRVKPQVLRTMLRIFEQAVAATVAVIGDVRIHEPQFTRQLCSDFERARDAAPQPPRFDISHQPELAITDKNGVVVRYRRLDLRLVFLQQVGRTGQYLCLECKYLDTSNRDTDRDYVEDGVERIVCGDYARDHPWAVMVGLERSGPLDRAAAHVNARLRQRYGSDGGFKTAASVHLPNVHESEHPQAGGPHRVSILHAFYLIAIPVA